MGCTAIIIKGPFKNNREVVWVEKNFWRALSYFWHIFFQSFFVVKHYLLIMS
jgi:hypothetical protein